MVNERVHQSTGTLVNFVGDNFIADTAGVEASVAAAGEMIRADVIHRLASVPNLNVVDTTGELDLASMNRSVPYLLETGLHQLGTRPGCRTRSKPPFSSHRDVTKRR